MKNSKKIILISDFDGTISKEDFFWYAIKKYLDKDDIKPWNEYLNGEISHVQALAKIFEKIRTNKDQFDDFILTLPIEEYFINTVKLCNIKNIPFHILSAGADYYIKRIIQNLNISDFVTLKSNKSNYTEESGLKFCEPDINDQFYSKEYGVSKVNYVKYFKDCGYFCIFAGDGNPDFEAAQFADIVFARGALLRKCQNANIHTYKFDSYFDIYEYIKTLNTSEK